MFRSTLLSAYYLSLRHHQVICIFPSGQSSFFARKDVFRAINSPRLQIVRIDRAGMMNDVIIQLKAHNVICAKNTL